jgi:HD-like signal output (HDOD) protein
MRTDFDLEQAKTMVEGINIPVRPAALQKIMELSEKETFDMNEIADVVSGDVSLAAGVLKTVNSPLYGLKNRISSIHQATSLLGLDNVMNLVIGISMRLEIKGHFNVAVERFWDTASDTALLSAGIAKQLTTVPADEAHALGLFHDCGIPLLMLKDEGYIETLKKANASLTQTFTEVEEESISTNHTVVGYYVAKSWRLPERICLGILNHHEHDLVSSDDHKLNNLIATLKLAEAISHSARRMSDNPEWERIQPMVLEYLGITMGDFQELQQDLVEKLNEAA